MLKMRKLSKAAMALALIPFWVSPALAATLKKEVTVYSNIVLAKDLFDDLPEHGDQPLFLAPDLGSSGTISAQRVVSEAHDAGIFNVHLNNIETVHVHRPSRKISSEEIRMDLKEIINERLQSAIDFEITTNSLPQQTHADPRLAKPLVIQDFQLQNNNRRFQAVVTIETYGGQRYLPVRGIITEMKKVVVLARDVERDGIVTAADLVEKRIPKARVQPGSISSLAGLAGKAATRNLRANAPLKEQDVREPLLVRSNDPVSITYAIPGLVLTAQGRALDAGAKNETISVLNLQSRRTIRGRVTDQGEVIVEPRKPLFANNAPNTPSEEVR